MDAASWDARYASRDLVWSAQPNRFVVEELDGVPPGRVLDLAAGEGRNALWLAGIGWRVTAVDFSPVAVERAGRWAATAGVEVDWLVADLRDYHPEPEAFDAVVLAYLHLPAADLVSILRRAAGALAPGGRLVLVGHDRTNLTEGVGGPQDPALLYTPEEIAAALPGLVIGRAERVLRPVSTDAGTATAIDTLVRAERPGR